MMVNGTSHLGAQVQVTAVRTVVPGAGHINIRILHSKIIGG